MILSFLLKFINCFVSYKSFFIKTKQTTYNTCMKFAVWLILILSFVTFGLAGYKTFLSISHPIKYHKEILEI